MVSGGGSTGGIQAGESQLRAWGKSVSIFLGNRGCGYDPCAESSVCGSESNGYQYYGRRVQTGALV